MRISDARKGLRVQLTDDARRRFALTYAQDWRVLGSLTSGRIKASPAEFPGHEEGLFVRVKWDALPTPEYWNIAELALSGGAR